jgi:hypothetical protein
MPSPPEFGAEVSVENQSRYPKPPREQEHYGYRKLVVAHHNSLFLLSTSVHERSILLFVTRKETVKILLRIR